MFTGIVEQMGKIIALDKEGENLYIEIESSISQELKIDQSISHDGCCLTVVALTDQTHTVTAIKETLLKTSLGNWDKGSNVNLERAMKLGDRLDGHMVQGHVDQTGKCIKVEEAGGSWYYTFEYQEHKDYPIVDKGSICINGVSLTVVKALDGIFSVAIIPYTHEHTTFHQLKPGDLVNLEFDVIGKYVAKLMMR